MNRLDSDYVEQQLVSYFSILAKVVKVNFEMLKFYLNIDRNLFSFKYRISGMLHPSLVTLSTVIICLMFQHIPL